jgi:hypothetical protein
MLKVVPFDCYKTYLALKNHFTKNTYDYHKYCGKTKASIDSFYKRRDRFWFEKISRQKNDKEVEDFFVANFVSCSDPSVLWIGEIISNGETKYQEWRKKVQSLSYIFKEETQKLFENKKVDDVFNCSNGHPLILKKYLNGSISIETLVICDRIFLFKKDFDKKLLDPVWETVSLKMKKYSSFLNINIFQYKKILREVVLGGK